MEIIELDIDKIIKDKRTQPRAIIDEFTVKEYCDDMENGDTFPPPIVFKENNSYYLSDGWHRVAAAEMLGKTSIPCVVKSGTIRDAILYSCGVNADHGKRRTNGDKERAVKKLLNDEEWKYRADGWIASQCKVTSPLVARIRKELSINDLEIEREVKRGDSIYKMNISDIGKKSEPIPDNEPEPTPDFFNTPLSEPKLEYDPLSYRLFVSPITEISIHIEKNSIDAIITDPPYSKEYIHTYEELAQQASIVLKPNGILVTLAGHPYIDVLITSMKKYLTFHWLGCYYMPTGQHASLPYYGVSVYWKPLIIMCKNEWPKNRTFQDVVINDDQDKRYHEWGQGISGFARLVEMFTFPNQTVLDPFVGGGTTGIATLGLGRYFIGSDISLEEIEKTRGRLNG